MKLMSLGAAPLSSQAFFTPLVFQLTNAINAYGDSAQKLASGNRIIRLSDDVASASIAAQLQAQNAGLKQASSNVAQATSVLQVASGGLQQISALLDSMKNLAIKGNTTALTTNDRANLQQQFSALYSQIDSIATSTNFNSMILLDGSFAAGSQMITNTVDASRAIGSITLTANPTAGQTIVLNRVTLVADTDFAIGADETETAANLAYALAISSNTALATNYYASYGDNTVHIAAITGGSLGDQFIIDRASSTAAFTTSGGFTNIADVFTLSGGAEDGLYIGGVKATGSVGNSLITAQNQVAASVTLTVTGNVSDGETLRIGDGAGGLVTFTYRNTVVASTDILIGATTEATLQNTVKTIAGYSAVNAASDNYGLRQLSYGIAGNVLTVSNRNVGNVNDLLGNPLAISETMANATLSAASFNNGAAGGVNVSGVANPSFAGGIQGFTVTYASPDVVSASITIGAAIYSATISDTTPGANTTVRFSAVGGGYFDIQLAAGQGMAVNNQTDANTYATNLNTAFNTLTFHQTRLLSTYTPSGTLTGSALAVQHTDYANPLRVTSLSVTVPSPGSDGTISFTINGSTYSASSGLGSSIGAYETVKFVNADNANQHLLFINGTTALDFSTAAGATALQSAFTSALGSISNTGISFQIGENTSDKLIVPINSAKANALFNGLTPSVAKQTDAVAAQTAITNASNTLQNILNTVAGSQTSLSYTAGNLQSSSLGITAANSALTDTDIVSESSLLAQNALRVNAGAAVLAQTYQMRSNLLALLQSIGK